MSKKRQNLSPSRSARRLQKSIPLRLIDEVTPASALPIANSLRLRFTLGAPVYLDSFFIFFASQCLSSMPATYPLRLYDARCRHNRDRDEDSLSDKGMICDYVGNGLWWIFYFRSNMPRMRRR